MSLDKIIDLAELKGYTKKFDDSFYYGLDPNEIPKHKQLELWTIQLWLNDEYSKFITAVKLGDNMVYIMCNERYYDLSNVTGDSYKVSFTCTDGDIERGYKSNINDLVYEAVQNIVIT